MENQNKRLPRLGRCTIFASDEPCSNPLVGFVLKNNQIDFFDVGNDLQCEPTSPSLLPSQCHFELIQVAGDNTGLCALRS